MKILTADIGTGTQDILLYDFNLDIENGFKLILPSPTMQIFKIIKQATHERRPILLTGVTMGGGPSAWAVENHIKAGLPVYATLAAAKTIDDDLEKIKSLGIILVSDEEGEALPETVLRVNLLDFDFNAIQNAFTNFGVSLEDLAGVAVAVFDHGDAPPNVSDRQFRFDFLETRIRARNDLRTFAFLPDQVPASMTRLQSVLESTKNLDVPVVVMDSAPAAILGASLDQTVLPQTRKLILNIGNFHTIAFVLSSNEVQGFFEHHTGLLDSQKLEKLILSLADGSLTHEAVYSEQGHGALLLDRTPLPLHNNKIDLIVTGPRRNMLSSARLNPASMLRPYFAVPFGDMMITGCISLLAATADLIPELADQITASLSGTNPTNATPWD